ncbi:MAG: hypothetical protein P4L64_11085 [Caulobacteraceae bacterium]|nr:hypothetical protein [Caulobacteraceae bacterium]
MAQVIIGGAPIAVTLPNFKALKAAWRYIAAAQGESDPMAGVDAILGVISVGALGQGLTVEALEERLTPAEMVGLRPFMNDLMVEIGLAPTPGETAPAEVTASPSTATSTLSSPSSSPPDAAAATGTT